MPSENYYTNTIDTSCAFCGGTGVDPFGVMSRISTCCVCGGSGSVKVQGPYIRCAHCRGTGAIKTLTCTVCGGKGVVNLPESPVAVCPDCNGTGDDASVAALGCLKCRGQGFIPEILKPLEHGIAWGLPQGR